MIVFDRTKHIYTKTDGTIVPSVTQILKDVGIIDPTKYTEFARQRGVYVHKAIEYYDFGELDIDSLDPEIIPYFNSYKKFLTESGFAILEIEKRVYNEFYNYAGTLDRRGYFPHSEIPAIIDIKTGNQEAWHALQTAGYAACLERFHKRFSLYLTETGYKLIEHKDVNDQEIFLSCVIIYHWKHSQHSHQ